MPIKTNLTDLRPAKEKYARQIELLSKGFANRQAFPDGKITVFPWTGEVDDFIATKLRKLGTNKGRQLLFQIIPKVCNMNGCAIDDFIASEVMLVLMVSRSILHDDKVTFAPECPSCGFSKQETIKIPDNLEKIGEKAIDWKGYDLVTLPACKDEVAIKPLRVKDEISVSDRPQAIKDQVPDLIARIIAGIHSIGGGTGTLNELIQWHRALAPSDQQYLSEKFDELQPALSTKISIECEQCGKEFDHFLQLDEDFFRPSGAARHRRKVEAKVPPSVQI